MRRLRLVYLSGPHDGETRSWPGGSIHIGRSRENELVLPEEGYESVSGKHAEISAQSGEWLVRDLGSTNGTYLNGRRLEPGSAVPIEQGDELGFGGEPIVRIGLGRNRRLLWFVALLLSILVVVSVLGLNSLLRIERGFEAVAESVTERVYLLATENKDGRHAVGTGFLVDAQGWLATNAHVAELLAASRRRGERIIAIRSDAPNAVHELSELAMHPDYVDHEFRDDVALVRLDRRPNLTPLELAGGPRVRGLQRGARLGAIGFPANRTDLAFPRARLRVDVLEERREGFLGVGLDISPGMSGSPIVDQSGLVVGIVVGGHFDESVNWGLTPEPLAEMLARVH